MEFEEEVAAFMKQWGYQPTEFGRRSIGDPNFVRLLQSGKRSPTLRIVRKIRAWMELGPDVHDRRYRQPSETSLANWAEWTPEKDAKLAQLINSDASWTLIGKELNVSRSSARRRAIRCGFWEIGTVFHPTDQPIEHVNGDTHDE